MIRTISTVLLWINRSGFGLIIVLLLFIELTKKYHSIDGDEEERRNLILNALAISYGFLEVVFAIGAKIRAWKTAALALSAFGLALTLQIALNAQDRRLTRCPESICGP